VDPPGDRLEVADVERPRVEVPVPADDVEGVVVDDVVLVPVTDADLEVEVAPLAVCLSLEARGERRAIRLAVPGLYNVYNALGAASLALALGSTLDDVVAGLERFGAAFGRFERIAVGDRRVLVLLVKNPAGANEAVRTLVAGGAPSLAVLALNDEIWDVDWEPLFPALERIVVTGERAAEMALRCKYGGFPADAIEVVPELEAALDLGLELAPVGGELVVLPTYTAMLALRRIVADRGFVRPYWERAA
jgi:UDP-N-acetylmuramyl tripeptide synthase